MASLITSFLGRELSPGRSVIQTRVAEHWYRINFNKHELMVPTTDILKSNAVEIDRFCEAVTAFDQMDFSKVSSLYSWEEPNAMDVSEALELLANYSGKTMDIANDIESRRVEYNDNKVLAIGFGFSLNGHEYVTAVTDFTPTNIELAQRVYNNPHLNHIWHNGKFDTTRLKYLLNLDARVDNDTMLMHYIGINESRGTHSLKQLGQLYLQAPAWEDELSEFKKSWCASNKVKLREFTYDMIPVTTLIPYLYFDLLATLRLYEVFKTLMRESSLFMYEKLIEASNVYRDIELAGIEFNSTYADELGVQLQNKIREAESQLQEIIDLVWDCDVYGAETGANIPKKGLEFNIRSPKQLKWLLKKLLNVELVSTDKNALDELSEHIEDIDSELGRNFLSALKVIRQSSKYYDTYVKGFKNLVCSDGRIRCTYNLHGTETGRLSSTEPNMQNVPRNALIKNLITCKPGYRLVQLDYSQAELRVLTALSGDPYLLNIYETGGDLHDMMATKVFGPDFTKEQRVITKSLNFGIAYGRGPGSIAQMFKLTMPEAVKIVKDWYSAVPEVEKFIQKKRREPFQGENCKTHFGRERHFVITSENRYHVANEAINFPIQSTASDLTLLSILELHKYIKSRGLDAKIVATVHDSIVLEVVEETSVLEEVIEVGTRLMAEQPKKYTIGVIEVPFRADAETGYLWGELEKW